MLRNLLVTLKIENVPVAKCDGGEVTRGQNAGGETSVNQNSRLTVEI